MNNSSARKRFLEIAMHYDARTAENFHAIIELANILYKAESVGFTLDPDSVEMAVKHVLGVD